MKLDLARELPRAAQRAAEGYLHALATHGRDPSKWTATQRQHQRELLLDEWGKIAGPATRVPMPELLRLAGKPVGTTKRAAFVALWERFASLFDANVASIYPKLRRNPSAMTVAASDAVQHVVLEPVTVAGSRSIPRRMKLARTKAKGFDLDPIALVDKPGFEDQPAMLTPAQWKGLAQGDRLTIRAQTFVRVKKKGTGAGVWFPVMVTAKKAAIAGRAKRGDFGWVIEDGKTRAVDLRPAPAPLSRRAVHMTHDEWFAAPPRLRETRWRRPLERYWLDEGGEWRPVRIIDADQRTVRETPAKPKRGRTRKRAAAVANPALAIVGNPSPSVGAELRKAAALYRRFHGCEPPADLVRKGKGKGVWIALGELRRIDYQPRRGARRGPVWFHHFKPGCVLAASSDGKRLAIFDRKGKHMVDFDRGITR